MQRCSSLRMYSLSYNGGSCVATTTAYICQCTYPFSGSNCELTRATAAPQSACACILCPCPTPAVSSNNPCSYPNSFEQRQTSVLDLVQVCPILARTTVAALCLKTVLSATANQRSPDTTVNTVSAVTLLSFSIVSSAVVARKRALSNAPCANVTCLNGGECYMNEDGPQCTCPKPFFGERCEISE